MFKKNLMVTGALSALFILTCIFTVTGALFAQIYYAKPQEEIQPADFPRVSQSLQNDLNSALAPEFAFNFDMAGNPFRDQSGVSYGVKTVVPVNTPSTVQVKTDQSTKPFVFPNGSVPYPVNAPNQGQNVANINPMPTPSPVSEAETKKLLAERNRQIRQGVDVGDLSEIYGIDEIRPIGMIGTGDKNKVWLYSPSTKQQFTVRRGTKFRDGVVESVTSEGVVFRRSDGTTASRRWMKNSEKNRDNEADSPILRVDELPSSKPQTARNKQNQ